MDWFVDWETVVDIVVGKKLLFVMVYPVGNEHEN